MLLKKKIEMEQSNREDLMYYALQVDYLPIIELLREHGFDTKAKDNNPEEMSATVPARHDHLLEEPPP